MSIFLRTFTHVGFNGHKTQGALVDDNGITLFIHSCGWYEVDPDFVKHHDTRMIFEKAKCVNGIVSA